MNCSFNVSILVNRQLVSCFDWLSGAFEHQLSWFARCRFVFSSAVRCLERYNRVHTLACIFCTLHRLPSTLLSAGAMRFQRLKVVVHVSVWVCLAGGRLRQRCSWRTWIKFTENHSDFCFTISSLGSQLRNVIILIINAWRVITKWYKILPREPAGCSFLTR